MWLLYIPTLKGGSIIVIARLSAYAFGGNRKKEFFMKKTTFVFATLLAIALAAGLVLAGCAQEAKSEPKSELDKALDNIGFPRQEFDAIAADGKIVPGNDSITISWTGKNDTDYDNKVNELKTTYNWQEQQQESNPSVGNFLSKSVSERVAMMENTSKSTTLYKRDNGRNYKATVTFDNGNLVVIIVVIREQNNGGNGGDNTGLTVTGQPSNNFYYFVHVFSADTDVSTVSAWSNAVQNGNFLAQGKYMGENNYELKDSTSVVWKGSGNLKIVLYQTSGPNDDPPKYGTVNFTNGNGTISYSALTAIY